MQRNTILENERGLELWGYTYMCEIWYKTIKQQKHAYSIIKTTQDMSNLHQPQAWNLTSSHAIMQESHKISNNKKIVFQTNQTSFLRIWNVGSNDEPLVHVMSSLHNHRISSFYNGNLIIGVILILTDHSLMYRFKHLAYQN